MIYCSMCDSDVEGENVVRHADGVRTPLCDHCAMLYEMGQASPGAEIARTEEAHLAWLPDGKYVEVCLSCLSIDGGLSSLNGCEHCGDRKATAHMIQEAIENATEGLLDEESANSLAYEIMGLIGSMA